MVRRVLEVDCFILGIFVHGVAGAVVEKKINKL